MKQILVVGSLNMDTVIETPHMPKCGETIAGKSVEQIPGGKDANPKSSWVALVAPNAEDANKDFICRVYKVH